MLLQLNYGRVVQWHQVILRILLHSPFVGFPSVAAGPATTATVVYPNPPATPNFSQHPITSIVLIIAVLFLPCCIIGIILLWQRRKHFPIAGRGSAYLLWLGGEILFYCSICSIVGIAYPNGFPCGIEFFLHYCVSVPTAVVYMLRGWTLVFRLEIKNYLTELKWRQEKRKMIKEYQERQQGMETRENNIVRETGNSTDTAPLSTGGDANSLTKRIFVQSHIEITDAEPASIPGYFFINHRQWIEPKFLVPFVGGWFAVVAISAILVGVFDPDIQLTNEYLHQQGTLLDGVDYTESQFLPSTFLSSPACLAYGIKTILFIGIIGSSILPFLFWCSWRIYLDRGRQVERQKDQAECYKLVHGYAVLDLLFIYIFGFCVSIVTPLYLSYSLSRKHRQLIGGSKTANSAYSSKKAGDKDVMYNRLPHQRPYFTLKYILHNSYTYDVLLAFLQKEYSSENALFWSEARSFEKAAKELEARIPTWPSFMDPDGDGTQGTGMSGDLFGSHRRRSGETLNITSHSPSRAVHTGGSRPTHLKQPAIMTTLIPANTAVGEIELPGAVVESPSEGAFGCSIVRGLSRPHQNDSIQHPHVSITSRNADSMNEISPMNRAPSAITAVSVIHPMNVNFVDLHTDAERLKSWSQQIYNEFIKRSSVMEINIPEDLSKLVQSQLALLSSWSPTSPTQVTGDPDYSSYPLPPPFPLSTLYRQTRLAVFDLIQRDSFRRFILTPGFQQLLHQADEDELARLEKQQDLVADTANVVEKALEELRPKSMDNQATNSKTQHLRTNASVAGSQLRISRGKDLPSDSPILTNETASPLHHDQSFLLSDPTSHPPNDELDLLQLPGQVQPFASSPSPRNMRIDSTKIRTITIDEREDEEEEDELHPFEPRLSLQLQASLSPSSPSSLHQQQSYPSRVQFYHPGVTNSDFHIASE